MTKHELGVATGKAFNNILQAMQDTQALVKDFNSIETDALTASMFERLVYSLSSEYTTILDRIEGYEDIIESLTAVSKEEFASFYNGFIQNLGKFGYDNLWTRSFKTID